VAEGAGVFIGRGVLDGRGVALGAAVRDGRGVAEDAGVFGCSSWVGAAVGESVALAGGRTGRLVAAGLAVDDSSAVAARATVAMGSVVTSATEAAGERPLPGFKKAAASSR